LLELGTYAGGTQTAKAGVYNELNVRITEGGAIRERIDPSRSVTF